MSKLQLRQIAFTKVNTAELVDMGVFDVQKLDLNSVVVKTEISTISSGTEKANITGDPNVRGESKEIAPFPRYCGYSSAGVVVATGGLVTKVKVGDRVVVYWGQHINYNIVPEEQVVKIPDGVSFSEAAISFISTFPLAGIRKVQLEVGESCLIMGLGVLGQLAVKLARVAGAVPIVVADPVKERRDLALKNGADYAFNPLEEDFAEKVKEVTNGGVKTAIEVTGVGAGLNETLDCMARLGRVALLGCTRNSDFSVDYYKKVHSPGITLVGAHTRARPNGESYPHYFTHNDDIACVLALCDKNRMTIKDLITETHSPEECFDVYSRLVFDRNFPIGVQFDWNKVE